MNGYNIIDGLKKEFKKLYHNRDNPKPLPACALNPQESLRIYTSGIPHALTPYSNLFKEYLRQLPRTCGLNAKSLLLVNGIFQRTLIEIIFPEPSKCGEPRPVGIVSSSDFQNEFFNLIENLKLEVQEIEMVTDGVLDPGFDDVLGSFCWALLEIFYRSLKPKVIFVFYKQ